MSFFQKTYQRTKKISGVPVPICKGSIQIKGD